MIAFKRPLMGFFLTFVDFILKKVITSVWKKMRCWFVLIPNFLGAELSFPTVPKCLGAELSFSTGAEMSWCRTVLFPLKVDQILNIYIMLDMSICPKYSSRDHIFFLKTCTIRKYLYKIFNRLKNSRSINISRHLSELISASN